MSAGLSFYTCNSYMKKNDATAYPFCVCCGFKVSWDENVCIIFSYLNMGKTGASTPTSIECENESVLQGLPAVCKKRVQEAKSPPQSTHKCSQSRCQISGSHTSTSTWLGGPHLVVSGGFSHNSQWWTWSQGGRKLYPSPEAVRHERDISNAAR